MNIANFVESTNAVCEMLQEQHDLLIACKGLLMPDCVRTAIHKTTNDYNAIFILPKIRKSKLKIKNFIKKDKL